MKPAITPITTTTTTRISGGSVVLSNDIDDFIGPSQACINPLFSHLANTSTAPVPALAEPSSGNTNRSTNSTSSANENDENDTGKITIIPRKKRKPRQAMVISTESMTDESSINVSRIGVANDNDDTTTKPSPSTRTTSKINVNDNSKKKELTLSDCLACSGCVTSTETVLIEQQHSLNVLRERFRTVQMLREPQETSNQAQLLRPAVVTISPASWSDICRHNDFLNYNNDDGGDDQENHWKLSTIQRQFVYALYELWNVRVVIDANVPLQWSLHQSAIHFCNTYRNNHPTAFSNFITQQDEKQQHQQTCQQNRLIPFSRSFSPDPTTPDPSIAVSSNTVQYLRPNGTIETVTYNDDNSIDDIFSSTTVKTINGGDDAADINKNISKKTQLPIISSSCPATVCYIEKSIHTAVPHLHTVKSSMSLSGSFVRMNCSSNRNNRNQINLPLEQHQNRHELDSVTPISNDEIDSTNQHVLHIGIMPCHDKKLEASRNDFISSSTNGIRDVDIVITTTECLTLLLECIAATQDNNINNANQIRIRKEQGNGGLQNQNQQNIEQNQSSSSTINCSNSNRAYDIVRNYLLSRPLSKVHYANNSNHKKNLQQATCDKSSGFVLEDRVVKDLYQSIWNDGWDCVDITRETKNGNGNSPHYSGEQPIHPILLTTSNPSVPWKDNDKKESPSNRYEQQPSTQAMLHSSLPVPTNSNHFFVYGSGGYSDYVFRYACYELFGYIVPMSTTTSTPPLWKPVQQQQQQVEATTILPSSVMNNSNRVSARVARQRQRDYYEAVLYRIDVVVKRQDGNKDTTEMVQSYSSNTSTINNNISCTNTAYYTYYSTNHPLDGKSNTRETHTSTMNTMQHVVDDDNVHINETEIISAIPVLRFVIAYGMQTLQRALEPFIVLQNQKNGNNRKNEQDNNNKVRCYYYDYIEAMACPSGCINGGGQIRSSTMVDDNVTASNNTNHYSITSERETPSESRHRIQSTQRYFTMVNNRLVAMSQLDGRTYDETFVDDDNCKDVGHETSSSKNINLSIHTRYHVVPPMQYSMGAAAGVAVQDTQW